MLKEISCNLCKSNDYNVIFKETLLDEKDSQGKDFSCTNDGHGEYYRVVKCSNCGFYYCSPRPDVFSLDNEYHAIEDEKYHLESEGRVKTFSRNIKNLSKIKNPPGKLLEIGCAIGIFLNEARSAGWEVRGLEPSQWYVNKAKETYDLDVECGTCKKLENMDEQFDVVTMWDVIEHVDDPLEALVSCKKVLKNDGLLVFSTVDIGSFYARLLGKRWPWLMKMHIYYFDRKTIKQYLETAGLELVKIKVYKHIVSADYLLYKLKRINKFLYKILSFVKRYIFLNNNFYITVYMGDFMEVYAKKSN